MIKPTRAMVLAAGLGKRMRPLTDNVPKPLLEIGGRTLLDHALDRLRDAGVEEAAVNAHYKAELIEAHLKDRRSPRIRVSREEELLGVAGGIRNARPWRDEEPFFAVNADSLWLDGPTPALERMALRWNPKEMQALLLLMATPKAVGMEGRGDFQLDPLGRIEPREAGRIAPYYYAGVQLVSPALFGDDRPMAAIWNEALERGALWGLVHDGAWFHVGTPRGLEDAQAALAEENVRWLQP